MSEYEVIIEPPAEKDLRDILQYITNTLKEPTIARGMYVSIKNQILTLGKMPSRHKIIREQPFIAMGIRKLPIQNYVAFYIVDEVGLKVHLLRILYNRREWQQILET
ncbi:MAG TPA: type II toxin-antitoxin system RelE/ParE family toxin [Clostridia bacterium]|nr:type II toxin-antitoxin system RelE/ParE family toxin [Clostridia bacterium]